MLPPEVMVIAPVVPLPVSVAPLFTVVALDATEPRTESVPPLTVVAPV